MATRCLSSTGYPRMGFSPRGEAGHNGSPSEQNQRGAYDFWVQLMDAEGWGDLREKGLWP